MPREALIIIDMLNDFVLKGAPLEVPATRKVMPTIRKEIVSARRRRSPVIYVCDTHSPHDVEFTKFGWPHHAVKGTRGAEVVRQLKPHKGDTLIEKKTYSGFYKTRLESTLKKKKINALRLTGCVTHICVLFTAYEASLRGYTITVPEKCVAGLAEEDHDAALRIMKNVLGVQII